MCKGDCKDGECFFTVGHHCTSCSETLDSEADEYAKVLFDFQNVSRDPVAANAIIALGNHDEHIAHHAAKLYLEGYAPYVAFSGGFGRITKHIWNAPEAVRFADIARSYGIPDRAIITESASSNTGENIFNTRRTLEDQHINGGNYIVVERPYRALRTKLAFEAQWPEANITLCSPMLNYSDYASWYSQSLDDAHEGRAANSGSPSTPIPLPASGPIAKHTFLSLLVGDLQRNILYGESGLQKKIVVPDPVMHAYSKLIELGYTDQMLTSI